MDFLQRLKKEQSDLSEKIEKLVDFMSNEDNLKKLTAANLLLLQEQFCIMDIYNNNLIVRIELLEK